MVRYSFQDEIFRLNAASNRGRSIYGGRLLFEEIRYYIMRMTKLLTTIMK